MYVSDKCKKRKQECSALRSHVVRVCRLRRLFAPLTQCTGPLSQLRSNRKRHHELRIQNINHIILIIAYYKIATKIEKFFKKRLKLDWRA